MDFEIDKTETIEEKLFFAACATEGMPTAQRVFRAGLNRVTPKELYDRFAVHKTVQTQNAFLRTRMIETLKQKLGVQALPARMTVLDGPEPVKHHNSWGMMQSGLQSSVPYVPPRFPAYTEHSVNEFHVHSHYQPHEPEYIKAMDEQVSHYMNSGHYSKRSKKEWEDAHRQENPTHKIRHAQAHGVMGSVLFHPLEEYMQEIPERVMKSYLASCELGFKEFLIAEPKVQQAHYTLGVTLEDKAVEPYVIPRDIDPVLIGVLNNVMFEIDYWE